MIIGTITVILLVFGGGGVFSLDAYRSAIKDQVADKNRQEQVIELTKQFDNEIKDYNKHVKNHAPAAHADRFLALGEPPPGKRPAGRPRRPGGGSS